MRLNILAAVILLSPLMAAPVAADVAICDSVGRCVSGAGPAAAEPVPAPSAAPVAPLPGLAAAPAPEPAVVERAPESSTVSVAAVEATPAPSVVVAAPSVQASSIPPPEPAPAPTEVVIVTAASHPATTSIFPTKGMNKSSVTRQFGQPSTKRAPVGGGSRRQPPITRWDYDGYSVIFEYDHVVDTVQRGNPAPIRVMDGLAGGPTQ